MGVDGNKVIIVVTARDDAGPVVEALANRFNNSANTIKRSSDFGSDSINMMGRAAAALGVSLGVSGIVAFANSVWDAGVRAQSLERTFIAITKSSSGAQGQLSYLRQEANRLGLEFVSSAQAYKGLLAAARDTTMTNTQVQSLFSSIAEGSAVLGLSTEQTQGALMALTQMLSKGKVQAEELRGQLGERLPGAFSIAAKSMGMTTAELDKALKDGKVYAEDFLPKFATAMHERFGKAAQDAANTAAGALNLFKNSWEELKASIAGQGILSAGTSMFQALKRDVDSFNNLIKDINTIKWTGNIFKDMKADAEAAGKVVKFLWGAMTDDSKKPYYQGPGLSQTPVASLGRMDADMMVADFNKLGDAVEAARVKIDQLYEAKAKIVGEASGKPVLDSDADYQRRMNELKKEEVDLTWKLDEMETAKLQKLEEMNTAMATGNANLYNEAQTRYWQIDETLRTWKERLAEVDTEADEVAKKRVMQIDADIENARAKFEELMTQYYQLEQQIPLHVDNSQAISAINEVKVRLLELQALQQQYYLIKFQTESSPIRPFSQGMEYIMSRLHNIPGGADFKIKFLTDQGIGLSSAVDVLKADLTLGKAQSALTNAYNTLEAYKHSYNGLSFGAPAMESYYENTVIPKLKEQLYMAQLGVYSALGSGMNSMAYSGGGGGASSGGSSGGGGYSLQINTINISVTGTGNARSDGQTMAIEFDSTVAGLIKNKQSKIPAAIEEHFNK